MAAQVSHDDVFRRGLLIGVAGPPPEGAIVELDVELPDGSLLTLTGIALAREQGRREGDFGRSPGFRVKIDQRHRADLLLLGEMAAANGGHS